MRIAGVPRYLGVSSGTIQTPGGSSFNPALLSLWAPFAVDISENPIDAAERSANTAALLEEGWGGCKSLNHDFNSGSGKIFTESLAGFRTRTGTSDTLPGLSKTKVGCLAVLNRASQTNQTDFYASISEPGNYELIPGNSWFQFWIYPNTAGADASDVMPALINRIGKFLYPCRDGHGSCGGGITSNRWLWEFYAAPANAGILGVLRDNTVGTPTLYLTQNLDESTFILPNQWTLVTLHICSAYNSAAEGNCYEMWLQPRGGAQVKVAEYNGSTPGFTWDIPAGEEGGHDYFRMPTTFPANNVFSYTKYTGAAGVTPVDGQTITGLTSGATGLVNGAQPKIVDSVNAIGYRYRNTIDWAAGETVSNGAGWTATHSGDNDFGDARDLYLYIQDFALGTSQAFLPSY